jgi:hypothetical protein
MKNLVKTMMVTALVTLAAVANATTVIDFEDNPSGTYWVPSVQSNGYVATENNNEGGSPMGTNFAVDGSGPSNGTVHLDSWTNNSSDSVWTLTKLDGSAFSLSAFDFASGYLNGGSQVSSLTLNGITANGGTVSQNFLINQGDFQTLTVSSGFVNLLNVRFDAYGSSNRAAYDNIVVDAATVPEPTSVALIGLSLLGFVASRRKSAKSKAV